MAVDGEMKINRKPESKEKLSIFREMKAEVKRITWPTKKEVKKASVAVAVLCLIYIAYVGVIDFSFQNLFQWIFETK